MAKLRIDSIPFTISTVSGKVLSRLILSSARRSASMSVSYLFATIGMNAGSEVVRTPGLSSSRVLVRRRWADFPIAC